MSGDVQPRKRKDKRRKKDEEILHTTSGSDEIIHIQKDSRLGGNICAKIVFFCLLGALGVMIGLILTEYRGSSDVETQSPVDSPWSQMLDGWIDNSVDHHDEADHGVDHDHEESGEEDAHSGEEKSEEQHESEEHEDEHDDEEDEGYKSEEENEEDEDSNEDQDEDEASDENVSNEVEQQNNEEDDDNAGEDEGVDEDDEEEEEEDDDDDEHGDVSDEEDQDDSQENEDDDNVEESVRGTEEDDESEEEQDEVDEEDTHESKEEEKDEESEEKEGVDDLESEESIDTATAEKMKEYEAQREEEEEEEEEEDDEAPKVIDEDEEEDEEDEGQGADEEKTDEVDSQEKPDEVPTEEAESQVKEEEEEEEEGGGGGGEGEEETTGVALKFGVGVALVVVAHVVLVRKWNHCGEEGIEQAQDESNVSGESSPEIPDLTRRQTLIPPTMEAPVTSPPPEQQVPEEYEYSEQEYEDEEEEEEDEKRVIETLEDLKAKYEQMTPEDSDVEPAEDDFVTKPTYTPTPPESEPEEEQSEVEEEEEEEEEDDPLAQWKSVRGREMLAEEVEEVQTGSESEEEEPPPVPPSRRGGPRSSDEQVINEEQTIDEKEAEQQEYVNADITNAEDWEFREDLDLADAELNNGKPEVALKLFSKILTHHPRSPRAYHGKAQALDQLAEAKRSNQLLMSAINTYLEAVELPNIPDKLFLRLANRTIDRMRFKGLHLKAVSVHHKLISRFHNDPWHRNQLAVNYMMINRLADAELVLEQTRQRWPGNGLTQAHYGLVLKLRGKHAESIPLLRAGIDSQAEGTTDSHFYFHLGDALSRNNKSEEAMKIYARGVEKGLFRSVYQRSLYNVDRLKAQPWWTIEETTYAPFFKKLEENWKVIRDEGLSALKSQTGFEDEAESLRDTGNWKQFELFARGQKYQKHCERTPITCRLIENFPPASGCRRGQTKFSVMEGGTHVWPHCGPTNCRLRAHLGLVVPNGTAIRVADDTRNWVEGKVIIFDDSFEHEVWHKGTENRLVLIVDVWHPELTQNERGTLTTI